MNDAAIQEKLTEVLAAIGQAQLAVQQGHQQTALNRLREAMDAGREAMRLAAGAASATRAADLAAEFAEATLRRRAVQPHRDDRPDEYWQLVTEEQAAWSAYLDARSRAVERAKPVG